MNDYIQALRDHENRLNPIRPYFNEQDYKRKRHEFFLKSFLLEQETIREQQQQQPSVMSVNSSSSGGDSDTVVLEKTVTFGYLRFGTTSEGYYRPASTDLYLRP